MGRPGPPLSNAEDGSSLLMYPNYSWAQLLMGMRVWGQTGRNRAGPGV